MLLPTIIHCTAWRASVIQYACEPKDESMGQHQTCKKAIDHTNCTWEHKSALKSAKSKEWVCIYDLIGNNVFVEEWTGDNTNYWAIIPTAGFICFFVSNTETPFLHYYPSGLLQIEEKTEHALPDRFVSQLWILFLPLLVADTVFSSCFCSYLSLWTRCLWTCKVQWWKWRTKCKGWKCYGTCPGAVVIYCLTLKSFTQIADSYIIPSFFSNW